MKTINLKHAALAAVALAGVACCGNSNSCGKACSDKACDSTACADKACAPQACTCADSVTYAVYNPNQPLNLKEMPIFWENDKAEITQVSPTVTRKLNYLNDVMICIVDIKGPMAAPDPKHSHPHEQMSYIAEGDVIVTIGDESKQLKAGDIFAVPANVPHTVQALGPRLLLIDSFTPIREDFITKK